MGLLGRIFGSDEAISKTVDTVSRGLDKLVYTSEEKAEAHAADVSEARKMFISWVNNTQGQNLARRCLALGIAGVWLGQYVLAQAFAVLSIFIDGKVLTSVQVVDGVEKTVQVPALQKASELLIEGANDMTAAVMLILAFYFAAPHLGAVVDVIFQKFSKGFKPTTGA